MLATIFSLVRYFSGQTNYAISEAYWSFHFHNELAICPPQDRLLTIQCGSQTGQRQTLWARMKSSSPAVDDTAVHPTDYVTNVLIVLPYLLDQQTRP